MKPPSNPITLAINGLMMNTALQNLFTRHLPGYGYQVTSAYRSPVQNRNTPGAASNSMHQWNLARDIVITNKSGQVLSDSTMRRLWYDKVNTNWPDYTYFSPKKPHTSTGWIHLNLNPDLRKLTFTLSLIGTGALAWTVYRALQKRRTAK